jgi:hypothetical protein
MSCASVPVSPNFVASLPVTTADVVAHQAVSEDAQSTKPQLLTQQAQVGEPVGATVENGLAVGSTLRDMVRNTRRDKTYGSTHYEQPVRRKPDNSHQK